jgi:hypothetical protein
MNVYSVLTDLLRSTNDEAAVRGRNPVLLPRTAADELPPYREQPWIIDRRGYRKIEPNLTCSREQAVACTRWGPCLPPLSGLDLGQDNRKAPH